jgi:hypothetical protein
VISIEGGQKIAVSVVDGLKAHPFALAVVVINVLFIAFTSYVLYALAQSGIRRDKLLSDTLAQCEPVARKGDRQ